MITKCPNCDQSYEVDASYIGVKVECQCGNKWIVHPPFDDSCSVDVFRNEETTDIPDISEKKVKKTSFLKILGMFMRSVVFSIGGLLVFAGIVMLKERRNDDVSGIVPLIFGFIIGLSAFVSFEPKKKRFFFICPNPNCNFQGEVEYNPEEGVIGNVATILLMQSIGYRTILYDNQTVICPKCGLKVQHSCK